jgi:hypothetical protein
MKLPVTVAAKKIRSRVSAPTAATAAGATAPNVKQAKKRLSKIQKNMQTLRRSLWPSVTDEMLWLVRDENGKTATKGFFEIPRAMPLFMEIIDATSKQVATGGKSVPAGKAYLVLWSRVFDERLIKIDAEADLAMEAGYRGERNITTWRQHLSVLRDLGFIDFKEGPAGPCQYVLLLNPYRAAKALHAKGWLNGVIYTALLQRALDIGATDLDDETEKEEVE